MYILDNEKIDIILYFIKIKKYLVLIYNYKMANDEQIIFLRNYYNGIDPHDYYKDGIRLKAAKALPIRPVYVSDLIDQDDCKISFGRYRNKDDNSANIINKDRMGIIHGYNPETKLLEIQSGKKNPLIKRFNKKMRYVEPTNGLLDLSVHGREGRSCKLTKTKCNEKPDCIMKLNHLVKEYNNDHKKMIASIPHQSLVKTVKGAGRRSRRTAINKRRTSTRRRLF
jgi:hypothetical protein